MNRPRFPLLAALCAAFAVAGATGCDSCNPPPSCSTGQHYDDQQKKCVDDQKPITCGPGTILQSGQCVGVTTIPSQRQSVPVQ